MKAHEKTRLCLNTNYGPLDNTPKCQTKVATNTYIYIYTCIYIPQRGRSMSNEYFITTCRFIHIYIYSGHKHFMPIMRIYMIYICAYSTFLYPAHIYVYIVSLCPAYIYTYVYSGYTCYEHACSTHIYIYICSCVLL